MTGRINRLREAMNREGIDGMLVTRPENRLYLSGFTGTSGALLVTPADPKLLTDFRYVEQAGLECPHCTVVEIKSSLFESLNQSLAEWGIKTLGCEGDFLTYEQLITLKDKIDCCTVKPVYSITEELREIKDPREIEQVQKSVDLADRAFDHILKFIRPGVMERDIALELEFFMRKNGASGTAFTFIVASGPRSAMPHGVASSRVIGQGDLVTMDFGAVLEGYHSDITRTVVVGEPSGKQLEIYRIVLEAQLAGLDAVKEGIPAAQVDKAARDVISSYGYGDNFGHSTGHGVGLVVHENPRLSSKSGQVLKSGMVVTIEPGIYITGWGGVRIEDMVLVEEGGCRVFTGAPKRDLIICG